MKEMGLEIVKGRTHFLAILVKCSERRNNQIKGKTVLTYNKFGYIWFYIDNTTAELVITGCAMVAT